MAEKSAWAESRRRPRRTAPGRSPGRRPRTGGRRSRAPRIDLLGRPAHEAEPGADGERAAHRASPDGPRASCRGSATFSVCTGQSAAPCARGWRRCPSSAPSGRGQRASWRAPGPSRSRACRWDRARHLVDEDEVAGHLVAGQLVASESGTSARRGPRSRPGRTGHDGDHPLAPAVVGHAHHQHVEHGGVALEHALDLLGEDLLAAGVDRSRSPGRGARRCRRRRRWPCRRAAPSARRRCSTKVAAVLASSL